MDIVLLLTLPLGLLVSVLFIKVEDFHQANKKDRKDRAVKESEE